MVTTENLGNIPLNASERGEARINRDTVFSILRKYETEVPQDVWAKSSDIIDRAFEEFSALEEVRGMAATSAFLVHTRRNRVNSAETDDESRQLDDSARCLPILDPQYGIKEKEVELLWNSLPPFKVGEVNGVLNGKEIKCAIISVPITPYGLESCDSATKRTNYTRPRISQAAILAEKMGAKIIGLGETLASLTMHGKKLQEQFPERKVTTGHAFTAHFMNEWTKLAAREQGTEIAKSCVTIIGANGAIGSAITKVLLEEGVGELRLHDNENMTGALRKKAEEIEKENPSLTKKIKVTGGNQKLKEACQGSKIVLVAASTSGPFIKSEHLDPGTIVINDSQPPGITRKEAKKAKATTLWVVGSLPQGVKNTFNSGLIGGADWTCLLEVLAHEVFPEAFEAVGPVTVERVRKAKEMARDLGMGLPQPQSWGVREEAPSFYLQ